MYVLIGLKFIVYCGINFIEKFSKYFLFWKMVVNQNEFQDFDLVMESFWFGEMQKRKSLIDLMILVKFCKLSKQKR